MSNLCLQETGYKTSYDRCQEELQSHDLRGKPVSLILVKALLAVRDMDERRSY